MNNNDFSNLFNKLCNSTAYNNTEIANALKVDKATITRWRKGERTPKLSKLKDIAEFFNVDVQIFNTQSTLSSPQPISFMTIPLYGDISCGNGMFVDDNIIDNIRVVSNGLTGSEADYFAQVASGDSMINAGIENGDLLIFKKTDTIYSGQIGSFCIDDNVATCKKFNQGESFIQLIPMNQKYDPIVVDLNSNNFRVVGVLKRAIKEF